MEEVSTTEQQEAPEAKSLSDKELQDAGQLINVFIQAWKNYGLYPEDHVNTIKSFERLVTAFGNYFEEHGDLRLTIEKDRLLCQSDPIYKVSPDASSEDIITLLYRDGIKWIEFQEGLPLEEIAAFFRIAYKYRLFAEETEGDIVTALMDEELECIDFKAVDIFWQDLLLVDFSQLPPPAPPEEEKGDQEEEEQPDDKEEAGSDDEYARSIADPSISEEDLRLSGEDVAALQQMVKEEESWGITGDLFEVLLIILKTQAEQEKFSTVLGFISEEVTETIEQEKFDLLAGLFKSLRKLYPAEKRTEGDWRTPLVDSFFRDLSRPEIFQLFSDKLLKLETGDIGKLKGLGQALAYFSPEVIPYLVPVIMQRSAPEIQKMISAVIVHLSKNDIGPLEKIAQEQGSEMGDKLLVILNHLQGDRINRMLFRMCDHSSDMVRGKAIKELVSRDSKYAQKLFSLIDDPSKEIRTSILAAFAQHKSTALENMLLSYLKDNSAKKDPTHILAVYKTLGRCGSNTSVPFLRRILLSRGWNSFMGTGKLAFREGAAVALALLGTPEARDILLKASESKFKVVRKAFDKTKTISVPGENTDE